MSDAMTVGEWKKLLEDVPDDFHFMILFSNGRERVPIVLDEVDLDRRQIILDFLG